MSEDLSNTDHSTWELCFGSSLNTCCPAARCSMFALRTAPALSGKASPAPAPCPCSAGTRRSLGTHQGRERTIKRTRRSV